MVLIGGFLSPALIPIVTGSDLPIAAKSTISGLLAFGIPEIAMLIAAGIMGKAGFQYFKEKAAGIWSKIAPPEKVSLTQHRIGVVLFITPLVFGFLQPYVGEFWELLIKPPLYIYIISDLIFLSSFWFLGAAFWDKLQNLFLFAPKQG